MLVEIHMIQNHSPANLNRDDLGAPKTCLFGGATRARISSQSQKRSIRNPGNPDDVHTSGPGIFHSAMSEFLGYRTKFLPDLVGKALKDSDIPDKERERIVDACVTIAKKEREGQGKPEDESELDERKSLPQLVFLDRTEAEDFVSKLRSMRSDKKWKGHYEKWLEGKLGKKKLSKFLHELSTAYRHRSVDIALFGRMTTSEAFKDVEAAMQVAHAISTHAVINEVDYFTAVDDLGRTGEGAGHVDEAMFNSACFYKYFSLDWDQLVSNLAGPEPDPETDQDSHRTWIEKLAPQAERLAACTLGHFIRAAALTTPTAKQNSFASHCLPCGILVEIKEDKIPTSYANAFAEPVERIGKPDEDVADEKSIEGRSVACLGDYVHSVRTAYGIESKLFWFSPQLWRFPLRYWKRTEDGKKKGVAAVTNETFGVLCSGRDDEPGLVEAVVEAVGFSWNEVKDPRKAFPEEN